MGISGLGDGLALVAVPLLAAQLTSSPLLVAVTVVAQRLPWLLVALPAGALVDRLDRRRVAVLADLARAGTVAVLAAVVAADLVSLPALWIAAFVLGSLDTLATGASVAVLPRVVPDRLLGTANGRLLAVQLAGTELLGPAIAGALFAASAALPFAIDAVSFAVSAGLVATSLAGLATRATPGPVDDAASGMWAEVVAGLRWFAGSPSMRALAAAIAAFAFLGSAASATLVLLARDALGVNESAFGLMVAAGAAGMVLGGLAGGRLADRGPAGPVVALAGLAAAVSYLAVGTTDSAIVVGVALALEGLAVGTANTVTLALRQRLIPDALLGRVGNAFRVLVIGVMPLGALAGGLVADATTLRTPWIAAGVIQLVVAVLLAAPLTHRLGRADAPARDLVAS